MNKAAVAFKPLPSLFCPTKLSAHRVACIALYRALLVQCPRIILPPDTTVGPINAIQHQIRKGFRKNVNQTVPRYIVAALENGYQIERLLRAAGDGDAQAHSSVIKLLRDLQAQGHAARASQAARPPPPKKPDPPIPKARHGIIPLLDPRRTPAPFSAIRKFRRVPKLISANLMPAMRLKKAQPEYLSRVIRNKVRQRHQRRYAIERIELLQMWALDETEWEHTLKTAKPGEANWSTELVTQKNALDRALSHSYKRNKEIAKKMLAFIDREEALYTEEKKEKRKMRSIARWQRREARRHNEGYYDEKREGIADGGKGT